MGPDYLPPEPTAPERWTAESEGTAEPVDPEVLAAWWTVIDDPALTRLIERAVAGNPDLRTALSRLRQARASLGLRETDRLPSLDASGSATRSGSSEEAGSGAETEFYRLGVDAGWELDLFGGFSSLRSRNSEGWQGQGLGKFTKALIVTWLPPPAAISTPCPCSLPVQARANRDTLANRDTWLADCGTHHRPRHLPLPPTSISP